MNETNHPAEALAAFREGFSCSQAVFAAFAAEQGLDRETALKLSQAFGGGMAHLGEACGAVTGAFLAISLKHGRTRVDDLDARDRTYARMQEFAARFKARFGSLHCRELLGVDLGTEDGMRRARENNLFRLRCDEFVLAAAAWVDELLGPTP
jgi:C_GCAxxG_C_C family probable redox protein